MCVPPPLSHLFSPFTEFCSNLKNKTKIKPLRRPDTPRSSGLKNSVNHCCLSAVAALLTHTIQSANSYRP